MTDLKECNLYKIQKELNGFYKEFYNITENDKDNKDIAKLKDFMQDLKIYIFDIPVLKEEFINMIANFTEYAKSEDYSKDIDFITEILQNKINDFTDKIQEYNKKKNNSNINDINLLIKNKQKTFIEQCADPQFDSYRDSEQYKQEIQNIEENLKKRQFNMFLSSYLLNNENKFNPLKMFDDNFDYQKDWYYEGNNTDIFLYDDFLEEYCKQTLVDFYFQTIDYYSPVNKDEKKQIEENDKIYEIQFKKYKGMHEFLMSEMNYFYHTSISTKPLYLQFKMIARGCLSDLYNFVWHKTYEYYTDDKEQIKILTAEKRIKEILPEFNDVEVKIVALACLGYTNNDIGKKIGGYNEKAIKNLLCQNNGIYDKLQAKGDIAKRNKYDMVMFFKSQIKI